MFGVWLKGFPFLAPWHLPCDCQSPGLWYPRTHGPIEQQLGFEKRWVGPPPSRGGRDLLVLMSWSIPGTDFLQSEWILASAKVLEEWATCFIMRLGPGGTLLGQNLFIYAGRKPKCGPMIKNKTKQKQAFCRITWPFLHWKRPWCWKRLKAKGEGGQRMRWLDGITDSMDMVWANSGRWWRTEEPGVL